jgi:Flp pilus assembly protein TadD
MSDQPPPSAASQPPDDREQLLQRLQAAERALAVSEKKRRRLVIGLAVSVLLLVVEGGGAALWLRQHLLGEEAERARHRAAVERNVEEALRQAAAFRIQARWADAQAAVEKADALLGDDGPDELRERVKKLRDDLAQVRRDQEMIRRLEEIRALGAAPQRKGVDGGAAPRYRAAFREWGLDLEDLPPEEASKRIRTSPIGPAVTAALDAWARVSRKGAEVQQLRSLATLTDSDPWRRRVREALTKKDREEIDRLARADEVQRQPPSGFILLADALHSVGLDQQRLKVLRGALMRFPADFSLSCELAGAYSAVEPPQPDEAIKYYHAALALRPDSTAVLVGLGNNMLARQRFGEAIEAYRRAIQLKLDDADAHYGLAVALHKQGKLDEAVTAYRETLRLAPRKTEALENLDRLLKGKKPE